MRATKETMRHNFGAWAEQLACPVCFQTLNFEQTRVVCTACGRSYPIVDGIAVLILERAQTAQLSTAQDAERS